MLETPGGRGSRGRGWDLWRTSPPLPAAAMVARRPTQGGKRGHDGVSAGHAGLSQASAWILSALSTPACRVWGCLEERDLSMIWIFRLSFVGRLDQSVSR
jgi:hypothetical protein